jgi:outer membrane protein assembly factor BamB
MSRPTRRFVLPLLATAASALIVPSTISGQTGQAGDRYWPQWRGPHATGVSRSANPPVEWSETKNVRWKVVVPGRGSSSPVVWGDRVFLLTAVPEGVTGEAAHRPLGRALPPHKFTVLAIDRRTGRTVWERVARTEAPHEGAHAENGTWASPSAVTDGEHVIASFESRGIFAYDMNGTLVWQKDLGDKRMRSTFGEGSTPALHGRHLVIVWDHQGESFIVALDKRTGAELWRKTRQEIDTWATPLIVTVNGRAQVIAGAMNQIQSYDLETGDVVWHSPGLTMNAIPSPVASDGMVFLTSGFRGNSLKAIKLAEARGDITSSGAIAWSTDRDTPYVPSPVLYDGVLYVLKTNSGILTAYNAKTGEPHYALQRLDAVPNVFASPIGAGGRIYIPGREGATVVLKHGPAFEILATNTLEDGFDASPAVVDNELFLRGYKHLYCIASN